MPALPKVPEPGTVSFRLANALFRLNTWLYRRTGGRLGNTVKGATQRTAPVLYLEDGTDLVVVGSRGGSTATPAWFLNLMANPTTTVQVGSERRSVIARKASDEERARLWPRLVDMYPDYDAYQRRTERQIPVVILSPA
jgi:deazaflavin-dependent oxidoreductase (nitroreductase family)